MQWKKHNTPDVPIAARTYSSNQEQRCPVLHVVGASEYGVVLESQRGFDVGSALTIGFHVDSCIPGKVATGDSSFISAESIVVESHPEVAHDGSLVYRVTLMFSDISTKDSSLLIRASEGSFREPRSNITPHFGLN